jgi:hypothetical protein
MVPMPEESMNVTWTESDVIGPPAATPSAIAISMIGGN